MAHTIPVLELLAYLLDATQSDGISSPGNSQPFVNLSGRKTILQNGEHEEVAMLRNRLVHLEF